MYSLKRKNDKRHYSKKDKQLMKLISSNAESDEEGSEHELSYYLNDRVKMMKEILKIIKPRKIKTMAPDCMKNMDIEEINSMLLEELLGISNKRLGYIFNGQNLNEESSSTDPEDQSADIISLDDISDDDLVIDLDSGGDSKKKLKNHKAEIKEEPRKKKVKKEKHDRNKKEEENPMNEKNLMSVLELLELQARARAIRSQLILESKKPPEPEKSEENIYEDNDEDAVIVESPKNVEIIITSSESENEQPTEEKPKESEGNVVNKNKTKTINNGVGTSNLFLKNSHKNGTLMNNNTEISQETSGEVSVVNQPSADPKIAKEPVADIPHAENESNEINNSVNTNKGDEEHGTLETQEDKEKTAEEQTENCQVALHKSEKNHECRKEIQASYIDKVSADVSRQNDKGSDEMEKNKKYYPKRVCKSIGSTENRKLVNTEKSNLNNEESIILNIDEDDMDCIYLYK